MGMGNRFLPPLLLAPLSIAACAPCAPAIQVGAKSIPADGVSEVLVTILTGRQCADEYSLTTDLGHLSSGVGKTPYRTEYSLRSGNVPGTATVTIQGFAISDAIEFEAPAAIGAQLHLHGPISEGDGTHAWQVDEAQAWNVPVLWWTCLLYTSDAADE